jgi:hypothetical protein
MGPTGEKTRREARARLGADARESYELERFQAKARMTEPPLLQREEMLRIRLELLQREHRDLDAAIAALDLALRADPLSVRRLKKRKLMLKDEMARISDEITPDIIA